MSATNEISEICRPKYFEATRLSMPPFHYLFQIEYQPESQYRHFNRIKLQTILTVLASVWECHNVCAHITVGLEYNPKESWSLLFY